MVRSRRTVGPLLTLVVVLATPEVAPAMTPASSSASAAALASATEVARTLEARASAIRSDLVSGNLEGAVSRLVTMSGTTPDLPPDAGPHVASRGVPHELNGLLAAARSAVTLVERGLSRDGSKLAERTERFAHETALGLTRGEPVDLERARRLSRDVKANPTVRATAGAGLLLARAIDLALPKLAAAAPRASGTGPCDVLDQRPWLCVAGSGPTTQDADAVVIIDQGGDDTYTGVAGGASDARCAADPAQSPWCRVSVVIDLGGNDRYAPDPVKAIAFNHLVSMGAGLNGVGILVDAAGNDVYEARVPERPEPLDHSMVMGSTYTGVGLLADLSGDDRYDVTVDAREATQIYAQGAALDGLGALVDLDGTNSYTAAITGRQPRAAEFPARNDDFVNAQGVGLFGAGALADRTGRAALSATVDVAGEPGDLFQITQVISQGVGLIGTGALITGSGPTVYSAVSRRSVEQEVQGPAPSGRLPGGTYNTSQGVGAAGAAYLDDAGGDDVYRVIAESEHTLRSTASQGCGCSEAVASLDATGLSDGFPTYDAGAGVSVHGLASAILAPDAGALLRDGGGNDLYEARATSRMTAIADNKLGSGGATAEVVRDRFAVVNAFGQGLGSDEAPGIVMDASGNDEYVLEAISHADASAESEHGPDRSVAYGGLTTAQGQGSSYWDPVVGALLDFGGLDAYRATSASVASTSPNPEGAHYSTEAVGVQGAVGGLLADIDDNRADLFTSYPAVATAAGMRGEGPGWVDVDNTFPGYGVAPLQPPKATTTIELDSTNPANGSEGSLPFRARVSGPGGSVAGQAVTFEMETRFASPEGLESWGGHRFHGRGVTDENGWATGWLDIGEFVEYWGDFASELTLRVSARYHGDETKRAASTTAPFDIP